MTTKASQITSLTVVCSTIYSDADQRKHQNSASLAFVWGIHRTGEFRAQRASYEENVSIWWRHHEATKYSEEIFTGYFVCTVNIWNVNCAHAIEFIFGSRTDILEKVSTFLRQKMPRSKGVTPNALPFQLPGSDIWYPLFWHTSSGGIDRFVWKYTYVIIPVISFYIN